VSILKARLRFSRSCAILAVVLRPFAQFRAGRWPEVFLREVRQRGPLLSAPVRARSDLPLLLSYADQWYVNLFGFLANRRLAHFLNRIVNSAIAIVLFVVIWWGASLIVTEISHAQL